MNTAQRLCRAHGNPQPKTDHGRIEFLLDLCTAYQGHTKAKWALLKALHNKVKTLTTVPFREAAPAIEKSAQFKDEINAQMGPAENTERVTNANKAQKCGQAPRKYAAYVQNQAAMHAAAFSSCSVRGRVDIGS